MFNGAIVDLAEKPHCNPLQGQYRVEFTTQGKPCFHYREPLFSLQGPCIHHRESCIHYREFPVRITTQGNPCNHYREWVCSAFHRKALVSSARSELKAV